jgi:hypothetical protein
VSRTSHDARAVVRSLDALTTQVRRLADALSPTPDAPSSSAVADGARYRLAQVRNAAVLHRKGLISDSELNAVIDADAEAPAAGEDAQHTARRRGSILNLLDRLDRHGTLTPEERALLRRHVVDEGLEHDTTREQLAKAQRAADLLAGSHRRAEQADAVTAETKRLLERRTTTLRKRAERAEAAIERARKLASRWAVLRAYGSATTELRAALDGPQVDDSSAAVPNLVHPEPNTQVSESTEVDEQPRLDGTEQPTTEA